MWRRLHSLLSSNIPRSTMSSSMSYQEQIRNITTFKRDRFSQDALRLSRGAKVAFQRLMKGSKRYATLFDMYISKENINSAFNVTMRAMNAGIFLDTKRTERLIRQLADDFKVIQIESLLSFDGFKLTKRILEHVIPSMILSGKVEILSQALANSVFAAKHSDVSDPKEPSDADSLLSFAITSLVDCVNNARERRQLR